MRNRVKLNIFTSFLLQLVTFASGLIIPRLIIIRFGSEVNGLISSLNQFLSLIMLLEGGLGSVVLAALYSPLARKDNAGISTVVSAANKYFLQLGIIFFVYSVIVVALYPFFTDTLYSSAYIISLGIVLALNSIIQYYFSITNRLLLEADQKGYVVYITQILVILLSTVGTVLLVNLFPDVIYIKLLRAAIYIIQPIVFFMVVKKSYSLEKTKVQSKDVLAGRWNGLAQNITFFIHSNTDVVILTLFSDLTKVSIYSVYSAIIIGMRSVTCTLQSGFLPVLGNALALDDKKKVSVFFEVNNNLMFFFATLLFGCTSVLIVPFVNIYIGDAADANYTQPVFALILILSEYLYCIREPFKAVDLAVGKFKETNPGSIAEAIINLIVSISLAGKYGLIGVAFGTLLGVAAKLIHLVYYNSLNVLERPAIKFVVDFARSLGCLAVFMAISKLISYSPGTLISWFIYAVFLFVLFFLVEIFVFCFTNRALAKQVRMIFINKTKRR